MNNQKYSYAMITKPSNRPNFVDYKKLFDGEDSIGEQSNYDDFLEVLGILYGQHLENYKSPCVSKLEPWNTDLQIYLLEKHGLEKNIDFRIENSQDRIVINNQVLGYTHNNGIIPLGYMNRKHKRHFIRGFLVGQGIRTIYGINESSPKMRTRTKKRHQYEHLRETLLHVLGRKHNNAVFFQDYLAKIPNTPETPRYVVMNSIWLLNPPSLLPRFPNDSKLNELKQEIKKLQVYSPEEAVIASNEWIFGNTQEIFHKQGKIKHELILEKNKLSSWKKQLTATRKQIRDLESLCNPDSQIDTLHGKEDKIMDIISKLETGIALLAPRVTEKKKYNRSYERSQHKDMQARQRSGEY